MSQSRIAAAIFAMSIIVVGAWFALRTPHEGGGVSPLAGLEDHPGRSLYRALKCHSCHGRELGGGRKGPALFGIDRNWNTESLSRFLKTPDEFTNDTRIAELQERYAPITMPSFPIPDDRIAMLVDFLLSVPARGSTGS